MKKGKNIEKGEKGENGEVEGLKTRMGREKRQNNNKKKKMKRGG